MKIYNRLKILLVLVQNSEQQINWFRGGSRVRNIRFTPALRHNNRGINVVATCDNCKDIFPEALRWITRFF